MPSIKEFEKKKKKNTKNSPLHSNEKSAPEDLEKHEVQRRRPSQLDEDTVDTQSFQSFSEPERFELQFPGSFILKEKIPKAFNLAERIAGDWLSDGKFEALPVGHPLAQILAAKALVKAKSLEKEVMSSAPLSLVKIGWEYAKSKIKRHAH